MKKINIEYLIDEEEYKRLEAITEKARENGLDTSPEEMFCFIMTCGLKFDMDSRFKLFEWKCGLREMIS